MLKEAKFNSQNFTPKRARKILLQRAKEDQKSRQKAKRGFDNIYRDEEGRPIDMSRLERRPSHRKKFFLWGMILLLFIILMAVIASFWVFNSDRNRSKGESIQLEIKALDKIASGDEITYEISYLNQDRVNLREIELTAQYPQGFYFISASKTPENEFNNVWNLGNLSSGMGGKLEIKGQLLGEVNTTKTLTITATYKPANFNYEFQEVASKSITISSSIIDLVIKSPLRVIRDKEFEYQIQYKNTSDFSLENLKIKIKYPEDFVYQDSNPNPTEAQNIWLIDKLAEKAEGEIKIQGVFQGEAGELKEIKVQVGLVESGIFKLQVEKSVIILVVKPDFDLSLEINDSSQDGAIQPGGTLNYHLQYQNTGDIEMRDLVLTAELQSETLDFDSLQDENKGTVVDNKIIWDKNNIPNLALIKPQEGGELSFKIKIKSNLVLPDERTKDFQVVSLFKIKSSPIEELGGEFEAESNRIVTQVRTQVGLNVEGRYYSDEFLQLGSGPLPPVVGETTTYKIFWYLSNSTSDIKEVEVVTTLPSNVLWTGKSSVTAGSGLKFESETRKVIWDINMVPAGTGQLFPSLEASFEVSITPIKSDLGKILILTSQTVLEAKDGFTGQSISLVRDLVTTDLKNDVAAQDKGKVIKGGNSNTNSSFKF